MEVRKQLMARERDEIMERTEQKCGPKCGRLPACAPLANPYVPFQCNNPPTYPARDGVVRGTLFPGLDLPFMGMVNEAPLSDTPMHELQSLGFAMVELGEYLDTHQDDEEAFELFKSYAELHRKGVETYEREYGPLSLKSAANFPSYRWMQGPWPWEYAANHRKEG